MDNAAIRVLLVDDDEDERLIVGDMLRVACTETFDLLWASTYEQGVESIRQGCCDVCLIDYRLGEHNGLDLLAEVTAKPGHPQVILLTGAGDRGVDVAATRAGAADYLVKDELTAALLERSIRYAAERGRTMKALREARESLSLNLAKSAFLTGMSHEMRTPMNAILGMTDMLRESPLSAQQKGYLEVLRHAGSNLLVLINDILDLATFEAGHLKLARVKFDLEKIMDRVIDSMAEKARSKGLVLLAHLSPGVSTSVIGDPNRLRQILTNLLGNAVKFTDSGEILLSVRNHESGKAGHLEFTVYDTGIGIPPEKLKTIFDDFTQADASLTRKYGGTGLGLGISRRLAEAMGGGITATSRQGQGSTFRLSVPFEPAPEDTGKVRVALGGAQTKRVLLIDDHPTGGLVLQGTLKTWGLESDAFQHLEQGLAHLREALAGEQPYSLALLSTGFRPGTDGFRAAAETRRIAPGLPVVLLVSAAQGADATRWEQAGLAGYAIKPVTRMQLQCLVADALSMAETSTLPFAHAERKTAAAAEPALAGPDRGRLSPAQALSPSEILIVEDSPDNRVLLQVFLQDSPYHLTFEEDGKAGVERFAGANFDLILMDVQMPVMDGLTATRTIRALEQERHSAPVQIIALTAGADSEAVESSLSAGCNAHIAKPVSKSELIGAIEKHRQALRASC
jgi:signal transduction histidine kinase